MAEQQTSSPSASYVTSPRVEPHEMVMTGLGADQGASASKGSRQGADVDAVQQRLGNMVLQEQQKILLQNTMGEILKQAQSPVPLNYSITSPSDSMDAHRQQHQQSSPRNTVHDGSNSAQAFQQNQISNMISLLNNISPQHPGGVVSPVVVESSGSMSPIPGRANSEIPFGRFVVPQNLTGYQVPPGGQMTHDAMLAAQQKVSSPRMDHQGNEIASPVTGLYGSSIGSIPLVTDKSEVTRFPTVAEYVQFLEEMRKKKAMNPELYANIILPEDTTSSGVVHVKSLDKRGHDPSGGDNSYDHQGGLDTRTTMMLRNIPNKYTQPMLLKTLDENGFAKRYDFFYLPIDFRNRCNVGYAFINFSTPQDAKLFLRVFHKFKLKAYNSPKVCEVNYARVQGLQANIEVYRNSPVNGIPIQAYRPLIFRDGEVIDFPKPDAPLPPIQLRQAQE